MNNNINKPTYNPENYGVKPSTFDGTEKSANELVKNLERWMFVDNVLSGAYIGRSFADLLAEADKRRKKEHLHMDWYPWKHLIKTPEEAWNIAKESMYDIIKARASNIYTQDFVAHQEKLQQLLWGVKKHLLASVVKNIKDTPFYNKKAVIQSEDNVNTLFQEFVDVFEDICEKAYRKADSEKRLFRSELHELLQDRGIDICHMNSSLIMVYEIIQEQSDVIVWRNSRDAMKWRALYYKIIEDTDHAWIKEYIDLYHKIVMFY